MSQHTKEPWKVDNQYPTLLVNSRNRTIGSLKQEVDATRIVACVNACAGLNPSAYREVVEALKDAQAALDHPEDHEWASKRITNALTHAQEVSK